MLVRARLPAVEALVVLGAGLALGAGAWAAVAALAAVLVTWAGGVHRPRLVPSAVADAPVLLVAALAVGALTSVATGAVALAALLAAHGVLHARTRRAQALRPRRVLVVGTDDAGLRVADTLLARPEAGLLPVGFVGPPARGLPLTWLGDLDRLDDARAETGAAVVTTRDGVDGAAYTSGRGELGLVPVGPARGARRVAGQVGQGLVAIVLLVLVAPPTAVLALLVRLETGGVLVREGGRLRFRTRHAHSFARAGTTWSVAISGRTGPVGRALVRTGLDRLPEAVRHLVRQVVGDRSLRRATRAPVVALPQRPRRAATSRR